MPQDCVPERVDIVILGGGMAALCMGRLLAREVPQATVLSVDKSSGPRRKVGESTVEIGAHFLNARLGLGEVLARTQLPKNGLRFWFDSPEHDLSFQEASEDGPATFAYWRTYQLERDTVEKTLLEANRSAGIKHLYDTSRLSIAQGDGDTEHLVSFVHDGKERAVSATWLIDASGIASVHGRAQKNLVADDRLTHSACWTWFKGVKQLDRLIEEGTGPARFNWGPRFLSTNHLLNEGYWIWLIPLASGLYSVGLGYDRETLKDPPQTKEELLAFLRSHRMANDLLGDAEALEFGVLKNFTYRPKRSLLSDRVAWIGTAAGFVDPFFSNGVDMIALGCELTCDLIKRDLGGEGLDADRLEAHNTTLSLVFEHFLVSVCKLYPTYVSQELSLIRYRRDVHVYWAIYTWPYFAGVLNDPEFLEGWHALSRESTERGRFFTALLTHAHSKLKERGELHRNNRGHYTFNQLGFRNTPYVRFEQQMGHRPEIDRLRTALDEIDVGCFLAVLDALTDADRSPLKRLLFEAASAVHSELLDAWRGDPELSPAFWTLAFAKLAASIQQCLEAEGVRLPVLELDAAVYRRLLPNLLELCESAEDRLKVRKHFNGQPQLRDFSDLPPAREQTQPRVQWSVDHTAWLDATPEFNNVYDLLGETWWTNPKTPFSALVKWGVRPILGAGDHESPDEAS
jgi:flavin-dependent dehydrogenase